MTDVPVTFLLNWHATSYHAPIFLAQAKGYFKEEGVSVAILEPNDPSDCAGLVGRGVIDMGVKAMVHTIVIAFPESLQHNCDAYDASALDRPPKPAVTE